MSKSSRKKQLKIKYKCLKPLTFDIKDEKRWLNYLNINGYVVIRKAISLEDAEESLNMCKDDWCYVSPNFDWNDKNTWINDNCPMVWNKSSVVFNGFGKSDSNWN